MRQIQVAASKLPVTKYNKTHEVFHGYWKNASHQREFFQWFSQQNNFTSLDDWYNITSKDIHKAGGGTLINTLYKGSLHKALKVAYPHHDWKIWKFKQVPRHYWANEGNVREYLQWLSEQLAITKFEDWYSVNQHTIPRSLILRYGNVSTLLKKFFPGFLWRESPRRLAGSKAQESLMRFVQNIFPNCEVKMDYRHPEMLFEDSQYRMELDIFLPSKDIAFEYHGEQHYKWHYLSGDPTAVQKRDQAKRDTCKAAGITLIEVPFWWDRNIDSLIATIHQHRPDLIQHKPNAKPISPTMPHTIATKFKTATSSLSHELAKPLKWGLDTHSDINVSSFHVTKLMGGLRVYWNGKSQLMTLNGNILSAPKAFLDSLPKFPVDAELHCGPDSYFEIPKLLRSQDWRKISMYVLDMPSQTETFEVRHENLRTSIHDFNASQLVDRIPVELAHYHVFATNPELDKFLESNAESGALLRRAHSHYVAQSALFIHKEISEEALLVESQRDSFLVCRKSDGSETQVQGNLSEYPVGSVVIVKSRNGNPISMKLAKDLKWEEVLKDEYLPYRVSVGKPLGGLPRCRACHRVFSSRDEPRLAVKGVFTPADAAPYPVTFNVCLTTPCISKSVDVAKKKDNIGFYFPPFAGKIGLPTQLKGLVNVEQLEASGTQFVLV